MTITALPTPPSRADDPGTFSTRGDALLGALPTFVTQTNAAVTTINAASANVDAAMAAGLASAATNATTATTQAGIATTQAGNAATSATNANASAVAAAASVASIAGGPVASVNGMTGVVTGIADLTSAQTLTNKTLTAPALGTPTSGNLTNCTADGTNDVGYLNIPQNSKSAAYTLVLADAGKHIFHPSADTTARIWTIPANASVAFPIGTAVTFINQNAGGVITIAITTDVMRLAGAGTTGSRTLAANGVATAIKVTATEWIVSGAGLS